MAITDIISEEEISTPNMEVAQGSPDDFMTDDEMDPYQDPELQQLLESLPGEQAEVLMQLIKEFKAMVAQGFEGEFEDFVKMKMASAQGGPEEFMSEEEMTISPEEQQSIIPMGQQVAQGGRIGYQNAGPVGGIMDVVEEEQVETGPTSQQLIMKWLNDRNLPITPENIQRAIMEMSREGQAPAMPREQMAMAPMEAPRPPSGSDYVPEELIGQDITETVTPDVAEAGIMQVDDPTLYDDDERTRWLEKGDRLKSVRGGVSPDSYIWMMDEWAKEGRQKGWVPQEDYLNYQQNFLGEGGEQLTGEIDRYQNLMEPRAQGGRIGYAYGDQVTADSPGIMSQVPGARAEQIEKSQAYDDAMQKIINKFYGQQIRLSTDQIEDLNATDVKNIIIELRRISDILEFQNNIPYGPLTREQLAMLIPTGELTKQEIKRMRTLVGFTAKGKPNLKAKNSLGNLLQELNKFEQWAQGTYVPLMRFGPYFIKVTNPNIPKTLPAKRTDPGAYKDKAGKYVIDNPEYLLDYQQFESKSDADKALTDIKIKYSDVEGAVVSSVQKQSLKELKDQIKQRAMGLAGIGQYLSESSAKTFKELEAELNQIIAMNNGVTGFDAFMTPRSRQGGVPGYSSDFARAAEQFIYMASRTAARNRFMPEVNRKRNAVIADAQDRGDKRLEEGVKTFYEYSLDPAQEFAQLRRIGFWWYLGGNLSSAFLQIFSAIQFTGPMLAELTPGQLKFAGTRATGQLGKAFKDATNMFSFTENQFGDALIDWTKAPPDVIEAIMQDLGTYLKVGMAMQEAGQVPGTETLASQKARLLRQFENLIIGGAFNSMEAISRLTGYIATYRTMASDPAALDRARTLFEGNQLFQEAINQNGGVLTPQIVARHVVDDTFGVYGKLNRPAIMRKWGSVPALFQTYIIQMFALMNRMLLKGKTPGQKAAGRRVFARMVLMIVLTGGIFGLPGSDDAEDLASWMMENVPGVGSGLKTDVRAELREMLYDAGFGPGLINAMENGLIETFLNVDIQRRIALGNAPGSQQVRAITSLLGLSSGGNPADFAGAPGSVFMTPIKEAATAYREGRGLLEVAAKSSPLFIRNAYKAYQQSMGKGFVETNFGTVTVDDATMMESIKQAMGFGSARMKREREAAYMERFYSTRSGKVKKRFNAQITNAYRDILIGNKKGDSDLVLDAQQRIQDLTRELYKWNSKQKPADMIFVELDRLWDEA